MPSTKAENYADVEPIFETLFDIEVISGTCCARCSGSLLALPAISPSFFEKCMQPSDEVCEALRAAAHSPFTDRAFASACT